jgi:two-component system chemotaxis response regulator CheB
MSVVPASTTATIDANGSWRLAQESRDVGVGDAVLISSAAVVPTIAVILTGRLADGANGCRAVKRSGGRVLVQEPAEAQASSMPANAIATGCADFVLPLDRLATALLALTTAPGAADLLTVPLPPWASLASTPAENRAVFDKVS